MATINDYINKYLQEQANAPDKKVAARQIVDKLKELSYTESKKTTPVNKILEVARVIKNSANDSHIELIDAVVELLEQES